MVRWGTAAWYGLAILGLCLGIFAGLSVGAATASSNGILARPGSARAEALGGACSAVEYEPTFVWLNPASAARVRNTSLTMSGRNDMFSGMGGDALFVRPQWGGAFFAGGTYLDAGSILLNSSDGTSRRVTARQDMLALLGYSREFGPGVSGGLSVRGLRSELEGEFRVNTLVLDGGAQFNVADFLKAGVALRNIGTKAKYLESEVSPEPLVRAGIAAGLPVRDFLPFAAESRDSILLVADCEYRPEERQVFLLGGLEYRWNDMLFLRAGGGAGSVQRLGNLSLGLGIDIGGEESSWIRRYRLDYSIRLLTLGFEAPQIFGFTLIL